MPPSPSPVYHSRKNDDFYVGNDVDIKVAIFLFEMTLPLWKLFSKKTMRAASFFRSPKNIPWKQGEFDRIRG